MITPAHAEWVLLRDVYYHALKQSPSPEAAKRAIALAHKESRLRWRCTLREHKAQRGIMIDQPRPGMLVDALGPPLTTPPPPLIEVTRDYAILSGTVFDPPFEWERSYATRRDPVTESLFEYVDIVAHRDDVLARWPAPSPPPTEVISPSPPPIPEVTPAAAEAAADDRYPIDAVVRALDEMEAAGTKFPARRGLLLRQIVKYIGYEVSLPTLDRAQRHRRQRRRR